MSVTSALQWIENTDLSMAVREGALPYPILGGIHLLGIALFGGMLLISDLRLLGLAMQKRPVSDVIQQFRTGKQIGFWMVVVSGLLLAWAEPLKLYRSPAFWVKMALLSLVGLHALVFRSGVYQKAAQLDAEPGLPARAKWAAALSLILWTGLIFSGRLIAFDE